MIKISSPKTPAEREKFLRFDWEVYRGNPCWVPPVVQEARKLIQGQGLFFTHTDHRLWTAEEDGKILAKVAAFYDRNLAEHWNQRLGFLGCFEALPGRSDAVQRLFAEAESYLKTRGAEVLWGPVNGTVANPAGLLACAYNKPPCFMMSYNPSYYHDYFRGSGFAPRQTLAAFTSDLLDGRLQQKIERYLRRTGKFGIRIETFNRKKFKEECHKFAKIYSETFRHHLGYTPQSAEEVYEIFEPLKLALDPDLLLFAMAGTEVVGFMAGVPDYNTVLRRLDGDVGGLRALEFLRLKGRIREARMIAMGVSEKWRGRGIALRLTAAAYQSLIRKGYTTVEYSWVSARNEASQKVARRFFGVEYKRYLIYEKIIAKHPVFMP